MQNGIMAKSPGYDTKVSARLPAELYDTLDELLKRGVRSGLKFKDRKLGIEGVISAVIIDFFERPETERVARLAKGLRRVEAMISEEPEAEDAPTPGRRVAKTELIPDPREKRKAKGKAG